MAQDEERIIRDKIEYIVNHDEEVKKNPELMEIVRTAYGRRAAGMQQLCINGVFLVLESFECKRIQKGYAKSNRVLFQQKQRTRHKFNVGKWLPSDQEFENKWVKKVYEEAKSEENKKLLPPVQALKELIESNRYIWNLFQMMFDEIPQKDVDTPAGTPQVRDYHELLLVLNRLIQRAPEFNTTGLVDTPINAVLDYPMGTRAGYVLFNDPRVNAKMKNILDY